MDSMKILIYTILTTEYITRCLSFYGDMANSKIFRERNVFEN